MQENFGLIVRTLFWWGILKVKIELSSEIVFFQSLGPQGPESARGEDSSPKLSAKNFGRSCTSAIFGQKLRGSFYWG